jgi:diguanylate cyclase (GGDEF)-like protein
VSVLLDAIVEAAADGLGAEYAEVLETEREGAPLVLRVAHGWDKKLIGTPVEGLAGITALPAALDADDISATLATDIRGPDGSYGLLAAHSRRSDAFRPGDLDFLQSLAATLAGAIGRRRTEEEMRQRAYSDPLTGQPNRALLLDRLSEAIERTSENGTRLAVFFLDIDNFKVFNDSLGHEAGDEILVRVGPRLRNALFLADTVARCGGDEFAVLCEDVGTEDDALALAGRLQKALAKPFQAAGEEHLVTASLGMAISDGRRHDAQELVRRADTAMYRAKQHGPGRCEVFSDAMRERAVLRLRMERALRDAATNGELSLAYQPIVSLADGLVVEWEALLRWQHPGWGPVAPAEFIPMAEETGLIVELGRWVLDRACRDAASWHEQGHEVRVAVNLSPRQLADPGLAGDVSAALDAAGLAADHLVLEITEGVILHDTETNLARLEEIKALGTGLVVDDFGTGYSSLAYLKRFPIDALKIDRCFVAELDRGDQDSAIVEAVLAMARALGLDVVAEGVETEEQMARLQALGCPRAQGYAIARPMPGGRVLPFLAGAPMPAPAARAPLPS